MTLKNNLYYIQNQDNINSTFTIELNPDCFIYKAHFPELPITPGVCIIQVAKELFSELCGATLDLESVSNAKFLSVINPEVTSKLTYSFNKVTISEDSSQYKVSVVVADEKTTYTKLSLCFRKQ